MLNYGHVCFSLETHKGSGFGSTINGISRPGAFQ